MSRREDEVRSYATDLLDEVGVTAPPVDPERIAAEKGLEVQEESGFPDGVYGALWCEGLSFGIVISDACPTRGLRNFSVAHELGHYHIDGHLESLLGGEDGQVASLGSHFRDQQDKHEREADWFASELLMPVRFVSELILEREPAVSSIRELAARFDVSLTSASIRYANLTDRAAAVVLSHDGRIEWVATSDRIREHRWGRRYMKRELIPTSSAAHGLARDKGRRLRADDASSAGLLCEWFEKAPGHLEVEEESVGLGRYGRVLTLLWARGLPGPEDLQEQAERDSSEEKDWRDALRGYAWE